MFGRVHQERDTVIGVLRCGVTYRFWYLQIFLWECFAALTPKPVGYFVMVPGGIGIVSSTGPKNVYRASMLR